MNFHMRAFVLPLASEVLSFGRLLAPSTLSEAVRAAIGVSLIKCAREGRAAPLIVLASCHLADGIHSANGAISQENTTKVRPTIADGKDHQLRHRP